MMNKANLCLNGVYILVVDTQNHIIVIVMVVMKEVAALGR
jgi:hypothetical protein